VQPSGAASHLAPFEPPERRRKIVLTKLVRCAFVLVLLVCTAPAWAQTKMTIATGVDPVFSAYYVAQQEGLFKKHGLDVRINTGPSGSAMVSFLINGQIESAFGSEIAGVSNHNLDPNVVVVAQATRLVRWIAIVGRNIDSLDQLKGKKLGVARGSGGEVFWLALVDKLKLNAADYTVVNVEAPEMVAALERGNIDAYAVWEPWVTRGLAAVKNTKVLKDQEGILEQGVYIYMNLGWIKKNPEQAEGFMRALVEATDIINKDRKRAAKDVSDFLKSLDPPLVEQLMTKLRFEMVLDDFTISLFRLAETQLKQQGKLTKPLDLGAFVYPDLLKKVLPRSVTYKP
jgi:ABC-type nitrate/sulfonate/bicarbonate transport system substrate-binding protein